MAIEKILQTRIQLRYDEYTNWYNNNPVLKRGEIAIATIPENHTNPSTGEITQIPAVVMKVGTGAETGSNYRDLPFVSAKAADVLAACKSEASLRTFVNGVIADAGIASSDAMEALAGRVTGTENDIKTLKGDENTAGSVAKAIKDAIDALNLADTYAKKATTLAGYGIGDAYTKNEIDTAVQGAKDYAKGLVDEIPAQTDYTVTCTDADHEAAEGIPAFKRHTLTQNGQTICTIDIPKELVVEAGSVKEVAEADVPYAGAVVGDKYIELVIANQDEPIYVPAKDLVDIYTAKDMTGVEGAEIQVAISNTNEITATLVNGGIVEEKLAEGVKTKLNKTWEEVGVAQGLVDGLANGQVKTNKEAIDAINDAENGILAQAKAYSDGLNHEDTKYTAAADGGLKLNENNEFSIDDTIVFILDCGNSGITE
jgi:hypothetical protein